MRKVLKDEIWMVRTALTQPNFAILNFLSTKPFVSGTELYKELTKKFTRKTIVASLGTLSALKLIQPHPVPTSAGYRIGYEISPLGKELIEVAKEYNKKIEKNKEKA